MLRYLGMVWDHSSPPKHEAAQSIATRLQQLSTAWRVEFHAPGMLIFCAGARTDSPQIHRVAEQAGIVIGTLFARTRDPQSPAPDAQLRFGQLESKAFVQSRGQWLIDHAWGDYVAFGRDPSEDNRWVLKDPTGGLPCLRTSYRGVDIFFSRMADCVDLGLLRFTINEAFLNAHLMTGSTMQDTPALNEVAVVHRGQCVELKRRGANWHSTSRLYWNPLTFQGADDLIEDPQVATSAMRNTIKSTTASWASVHPSLLLRLSGGLDSSIVAGCLRDAPTSRFTAYTYFSPVGRSDERPWARLAAQHSRCEHIEHPIAPADLDLRLGLRMGPALQPSPLLGYIQRSSIEQPLAARAGATGIFTGEGGDSGFCADSVTYAVPEFLKNHGLAPGLFRLAARVALLTERSTWRVLTRAVQRHLGTNQPDLPRELLLAASQLVSPHLKNDLRLTNTVSHPWFRDMRRVPWDKIRRLGTLVMTPEYYNVDAPADAAVPEIVSPLYSQPAIEMLLRIPIYIHFHDGRDRGLARDAFTQEVPEPILRRLWKDRAPGFHDELLERERNFLKETFLDGALVHHGLLDRAAVEEALSTAPSKNTVYPGEIFRHLDTELWARQWWYGSQQQAAA
jgi:asparagine synthase (glutamine-hydrolysing)